MSLSQLGNASAFQNHAQGMIGEFFHSGRQGRILDDQGSFRAGCN